MSCLVFNEIIPSRLYLNLKPITKLWNIYIFTTRLRPQIQKNRSVNTKQWKEVFEEDIFVVQGMQSSRYAPSFDGGRFSPVMDQPTHCYHDCVARKITTYRG